ncbi:MAG TPA: dTMP kinase [Actinomycetota bacterium]|nr:dTMP kinase [Actinomycetota bacterium]
MERRSISEVAIQAPGERPELHVLPASGQDASYLTLLKNRSFRRLFLAQCVSSLGDWVGVIAIAVFADHIQGATGVGLVMTARVLPGFVVGPLAGVLADRFDRKRLMVVADLARACVIFSLPFFPNIVYLLVASMILESLTLIWGPAKDASLPNLVAHGQLTQANSLNLMAVYAPFPLASVVYLALSTLGRFVAHAVPVLKGVTGDPEALALWLDSMTFAFSALMVAGLAITSTRRQLGRIDLGDVKRDLIEGLRFVRDDRKVQPWLIGVGLTFMAAGGVFSLGPDFAKAVLGAGDRGFASVIGFLGTGMLIGLVAITPLTKKVQKDVIFSSSILLLGIGLITLASASSLSLALAVASALGFFAGTAYSTGYTLMQENTADYMRGRTFSAAYTVIRVGTLGGLGLFPFGARILSGVLGANFRAGSYPLPGSRLMLWAAGVVVIGGGLLSMRAIGARASGLEAPAGGAEPRRAGLFIVFEGGDGAGKSTQMEALVGWLRARGQDVVTTREPGGTAVGAGIRDILLDPASDGMDARTEALLYAADRAQHVAEVIKPALDAGKIVVSDRFIDSSLAYQGIARGLGVEEILRINEWGIQAVMPDVVFLLRLDAAAGLARSGHGDTDRIEGAGIDFHKQVSDAYLDLAIRFPTRFVALNAATSAAELHQKIVSALEERAHDHLRIPLRADLGPVAPPVPR